MDIGAAREVQEPMVLESAAPDVDMSAAEAVEPAAAPDFTKSQQAAAASEGPLFTAPEGAADDLKKITGIGPALERKLNALGVTRYDADRRIQRRGHREGRLGAELQGAHRSATTGSARRSRWLPKRSRPPDRTEAI